MYSCFRCLSYILVGLLLNVSTVLSDNENGSTQSGLPDSFDYLDYAQKFKKAFDDQEEFLDRAKLFVGRTIKIAEHNDKFLKKQKSYFLEQNQFTDLPPSGQDNDIEEAQFLPVKGSKEYPDLSASKYIRLKSHVVDEEDGFSQTSSDDLDEQESSSYDSSPVLDFNKDERVSNYRRLLNEIVDDPNLAKEVSKRIFIKSFRPELISNIPKERINNHDVIHRQKVEPTNENYKPIDTVSYGTYEDLSENFHIVNDRFAQVYFDDYNLEPFDDNEVDYDGYTIKDAFKAFTNLFSSDEGSRAPSLVEEKPIERSIKYTIDWRKLGCLTTPKSQGTCNSCYAFSVLSLMEFFYCRQTKNRELVDFSAQYIVDCGELVGLKGCQSGAINRVGFFITNYGIELESNYKYAGEVGSCPIEKENVVSSGYLRPTIHRWHKVEDISDWYGWLRKSPLIVGINMPTDFNGYGGGIHDGLNCGERAHAMLLVGSGSENGREFWLLRNSFSEHWGEQGYFRLSKDAPLKCFNSAVVVRAKFQPVE